jgi:hypothetical protein
MSRSDFSKRNPQTARARRYAGGRAGAGGRAREDRVSLEKLRKETARRAIVVAGRDPREIPMVVAACALMLGSGRADFSETEIAREVEALTAELRRRYGFTDPERAEGAELWAEALARLEASGIPDSTLGLWIRPLSSPGLAGKRLWVTAPEQTLAWAQRRYSGLIDEAIEACRPEAGITVAFMGEDPREDGTR